MIAFENSVRRSRRLSNGKKHVKKPVFRSCGNLWVKKEVYVLMNHFNRISLSCVYLYKNRKNVMETVTLDRLFKNRGH